LIPEINELIKKYNVKFLEIDEFKPELGENEPFYDVVSEIRKHTSIYSVQNEKRKQQKIKQRITILQA